MKYIPLFTLALLVTSLFSCQKGVQTRALVADTVAQDIQDTSTIIGKWLLVKDGKDTLQVGFELKQNGIATTIGGSNDSLITWKEQERDTDTTLTLISHKTGSKLNDTISYKMHFLPKVNTLTLSAENAARTYIRQKGS